MPIPFDNMNEKALSTIIHFFFVVYGTKIRLIPMGHRVCEPLTVHSQVTLPGVASQPEKNDYHRGNKNIRRYRFNICMDYKNNNFPPRARTEIEWYQKKILFAAVFFDW